MTPTPYSPSSSQFSLAEFHLREQEQEQRKQQLEKFEKLLSGRDFKERLTIFLHDLVSSPEGASLSDLPHENYFEPPEKEVLSYCSDINNNSALAKDILASLPKIFEWHVDKVQRYLNPENFVLNNWDLKFMQYVEYLNSDRECIPGTLKWVHEEEYKQLLSEDEEQKRLQMIQEEQEERIRMKKERRLQESRERAAIKRKETLMRKKTLLATIAKEQQKSETTGDLATTSEPLTTPTTSEMSPVSTETSLPSTQTATPSPPESSLASSENRSTPVKLTRAERRRETRKRKRLEKEAGEKKETPPEEKEEEREKEAGSNEVSDGPSPPKKQRTGLRASPRQVKL